MAVVWTFRKPSLCRHVYRECMRHPLLDVTPIVCTTACHQRHDVETYRRSQRPFSSRRRGEATLWVEALGLCMHMRPTTCLFSPEYRHVLPPTPPAPASLVLVSTHDPWYIFSKALAPCIPPRKRAL